MMRSDCVNYFKLGKYQSKYENPIYLSKILYKCLNRPMLIDELLLKVNKQIDIIWTSDVEQNMLLALCFAYSIGIIKFQNELLQRREPHDIQ